MNNKAHISNKPNKILTYKQDSEKLSNIRYSSQILNVAVPITSTLCFY